MPPSNPIEQVPREGGARGTPVPLLLVVGGDVPDAALVPLAESRRVQLFRASELRSSPTAFALRAARATVVATVREPVEELVFVRTAGYTGALVFAVSPSYMKLRHQLMSAGVLEVIALPIEPRELDRVLDVIESLPHPPRTHGRLGLLLDPVDNTVRHGDAAVKLSPREFALLHCLMQNEPRPVAVNEILDYVWGDSRDGGGTREIVDVNISQVRKKLNRIGLRDVIRTYRGFGYGL